MPGLGLFLLELFQSILVAEEVPQIVFIDESVHKLLVLPVYVLLHLFLQIALQGSQLFELHLVFLALLQVVRRVRVELLAFWELVLNTLELFLLSLQHCN